MSDERNDRLGATAPIPDDPLNVVVGDPPAKRARDFAALVKAIVDDLDGNKPTEQREIIRAFMVHLAWHEGDKLTARVQHEGGPARSFLQMEAQMAKDGGDWANKSDELAALAGQSGGAGAERLRAAFGALGSTPQFPQGNVIEELLRRRDRFGIYLARYCLKRLGAPIPKTVAGHADYWFKNWKKVGDAGTLKQKFIAAANEVDELLGTGTRRRARLDEPDIVFAIETVSSKRAEGTVRWKARNLSSRAVSGPFGAGALPLGSYSAPRSMLLDKNDASYRDGADPPNCWMQAILPMFSTDRDDLGVHPDGGVPGTQGCIGLKVTNTRPWYDAFYGVPRDGSVTIEVVKVKARGRHRRSR